MSKYFGTDGVRGRTFEKLSLDIAYRIGRYLGQYPNGTKNKVLIGRDTRYSGAELEEALTKGLVLSGSEVVTTRITTTPSISYIVEKGDFDFGIMISASHNPYYDNGIKIFNNSGEKLCAEIEDLIEEYIDRKEDDLPISENQIQPVYKHELRDEYLYYVSSIVDCPLKKFKLLLDCANGSAAPVAKQYFDDILKQDCTLVNYEYDGKNINDNCGSTHVENLCEIMKNGNYDIAFSFDGDADRLMMVSPKGRIIDGDMMIYLSALFLKSENKLNNNKIVMTKMSNLGLKKVLDKHNIGYEIVDVGDKYVQACLKEKGLSIGGEQSGHVIFYDILNTGCGLISATKMLTYMSKSGKTVDEMLDEFKVYPQTLINIKVKDKHYYDNCESLNKVCKEVIEELGDDGRILVRPSGTENLIRVMVEAATKEASQNLASRIADVIYTLEAK